jgi:hypothetical protein
MKQNKQILAFEQLESEMELIFADQMRNFVGGEGSSGGGFEYGIDSSGNLYYRPQGSDTWAAYNQLDEVEITGFASSGSSGSSGGFSSGFPTGFDWGSWKDMDNSHPNGFSGPNGYTYPNGQPGAYVTSGSAGMSFLDIAGLLNTSLGLASTQAQVSALAAKLETAVQFGHVARVFGVIDVASNVYEIFDNKASAMQQLEDGTQAAVGIALILAGGPLTLAIGGICLAGWELYEYTRDH